MFSWIHNIGIFVRRRQRTVFPRSKMMPSCGVWWESSQSQTNKHTNNVRCCFCFVSFCLFACLSFTDWRTWQQFSFLRGSREGDYSFFLFFVLSFCRHRCCLSCCWVGVFLHFLVYIFLVFLFVMQSNIFCGYDIWQYCFERRQLNHWEKVFRLHLNQSG